MYKARILAFFLFAVSVTLHAQQFSLRQYTVVDGLPQSQVNIVLEDPNGYLWIGTQGGGLARFDGREFKVYTTRDGLLSNIINYLKLDTKQNLWVVHPRGITRFDGTDFIQFQPPVPPYTGRRVRRVLEYKDTIYLVNNQGRLGKVFKDSVFYWDNRIQKDKVILYTHLLPNKDICFYLNDSSFLVWSRKGDYTVSHKGKFNQALNIFNYKKEVWANTDQGYFSIDFDSKEIVKKEINIQNHIIQFDSTRNYFWTNSEKGLFREFDHYGDHVVDTVLKEVDITQILPDAEGNTWLGSSGNGLYKYYMRDFNRAASERFNSVLAVEKGLDGVLWIGSMNRGLWKIENVNETSYTTNQATDNSFQDIQITKQGTVWVASSSGLGIYNKVRDKFKWYTREDGIAGNNITCLEEDDQGRIWYGTVGGGVGYYNGKSFKGFTTEDGLNGSNAASIKFFPANKTIYSGSEYGLNSIRGDSVSTISLPEFSNTVIQSINVYKNAWLLIGSGGAGVMLFDPFTRTRRIINSNNGLPSDFINFVAADKDDQIWVGTEKGITRIKLDQEFNIVENLSFGFDNGLAGVETTKNAFYLGSEKYFGLVDGLYQFNNLRSENVNSFDLHLTAVEIFYDQQASRQFADTTRGFFKIPIRPILPASKNHITFRFNRVDKRYPKSVQFKYFLENYDKTWSQSSSIEHATYGNLPSGSYVFKALATNSQGSWETMPMEYAFVIRAPFYQTGAFQVGIAGLIVGMLSLYLYFRVRSNIQKVIDRERIRQQEQDSLRKEIARDFHDEMGNQLTRIINYVSQMKLQANGHSTVLYNKVEDSAKYLYSGTRDFIWSIDPVNDELSRLFLHIRDFGEKIFEEKGIKFRAYNDLKEEVVRVPYGFGREANLIFKEAMTNVFAHAKAGNVSFSLKRANDQFEMRLEDDGIGFEMDRVAKLNGIQNMNLRAKRIHAALHFASRANEGTTISLIFKIQKNKVYDNAR
jgi:ligand-binding sensor domain-containing protein/signal transduction histidine kinase